MVTALNRIAVVEDNPVLARMLKRILGDSGYHVTVSGTVATALATIRTTDPSLIILDLMLPDGRGEDVLDELMQFRPLSRVLVLSSISHMARRVSVLDAGAMDFLAKPFANAELLARIRTRIRAAQSSPAQSSPAQSSPVWATSAPRYLLRAGIQLDLKRREVLVDGRHVPLTQQEFLLLMHLLQRAPDPCSRGELLASVWGTNIDTGTNVVDVSVRRLRWKLASNQIETVRNVGYRIAA